MLSEAMLKQRRVRRARRKRRARIEAAMAVPVLPTLLTLGNAVCGFGSLTLAAQSSTGGATDAIYLASLLIFVAMLFDMLDGAAARWTKQSSTFGMQLDSLSDVVSFGVAPAFLLLQQASSAYNSRVLWVVAALYLACTVLRLARFNVESSEKTSYAWFSGLPSPAAAALLASVSLVLASGSGTMPIWARRLLAGDSATTESLRLALPVLGIAVSVLMVSRIRFPHVAAQSLLRNRRFPQTVKLVFAIAAILSLGELSAPLLILAYVGGGPLRAIWRRVMPPAASDLTETALESGTEAGPIRNLRRDLNQPPRLPGGRQRPGPRFFDPRRP